MLTSLLNFLKIVSLLGLIVTAAMTTAVLYKKLKDYYPGQVEKYKWVFLLVGGFMSFFFIWVYQNFILSY